MMMQFPRSFRSLMMVVSLFGLLLVIFAPRATAQGGAGSLDDSFAPSMNSHVGMLALQPVGKIVVGGSFTTVNGVGCPGLARLNADGSLANGFSGWSNGPYYQTLSLGLQPDGEVVAGGAVTDQSCLCAVNQVFRFNAGGSVDASFNGPAGEPYRYDHEHVYAVAVQPDGKVLLGGNFTSMHGVPRNHIARLNADGSLDASFTASATGLSGNFDSVYALAVQPDGKVLLGGHFGMVNGVARQNIARLNSDGSLDAGFLETGVDSGPTEFALQADGKIIVIGGFHSMHGVVRERIARLNSDGSLDASFAPSVGPYVNALALQPDGKVLIGGVFTTVNGVARNNIARLNPDGSLDMSFDPGAGPNHVVEVLALQPDGKVLVGGQFTAVNGVARNHIARLMGDSAASFTVLLSGSASSIAPGETFTVRAMCTAPAADMSGAQLALHFDATRLRLDAVDPVAPAGLDLELSEQIDNTAGTLRYALGLGDPSVPLSGAADLCDMTFTVLPGADMCGAAGLVGFGNVGPFTTRFTAAATAAAVVPVLVDLPAVNLDTTAPALAGVPADISVATDAGSTFGALVSLPTVTASDNCDGPVAVTATGIPSGSIFPIGTTTVTWTATDAAGNTATASRTVTVEPFQLLDVSVNLDGFRVGASTRSIRLSIAGVTGFYEVMIPAIGAGTIQGIQVPVASGHACVAVKDTVHSLTRTAVPSVVGARYLAAVSLSQGDSNDDDLIEIVDYATWIIDMGPSTPSGRSNFNGDAIVAIADFTHIGIGFFTVGESCTSGADAPRTPRDRIHVKELRRTGLGELAAADLNHDGWVDTRDMQMAMQGGGGSESAAAAGGVEGPRW